MQTILKIKYRKQKCFKNKILPMPTSHPAYKRVLLGKCFTQISTYCYMNIQLFKDTGL